MRRIVEGGEKDWKIVAQKLGTERKEASVRQRWNMLNRHGIPKQKYKIRVKAISKSKTSKRIRKKASSVAVRLNKGQPRAVFTGKGIRWEAKEELELIQLGQSAGEKDWDLIAEKLGTARKSAAVRMRYNLLNRVTTKSEAAKRVAEGDPRASYAMVEAGLKKWKKSADKKSDAAKAGRPGVGRPAKAKPKKRSKRSSK